MITTWTSTSPDEQWVARGLNADPKPGSALGLEYRQLIVRAVDGSPTWTVIDRWGETGLGYTVPQPVAWSPNGKVFYFTNKPTPDGCSGITPNSGDLQSVDVETGNVTSVIADQLSWSALSHDGTYLAYLGRGSLTILDLDTGGQQSVMIYTGSEIDAGYAIWSLDDRRLAFTLANGSCSGPYPGTGVYAQSTSISVLDISKIEITEIIKEDGRRFVTQAWIGPDTIQLKDGQNRTWNLNAQTGQLTEFQP